MLTAFWEAVGNRVADRWAATSAPAVMFWLGGVFAWALRHGGVNALTRPADWLGRQPVPSQLAIAAIALAGVAASVAVVERLTVPVLRLIEGYWPGWLDPVRQRLVDRLTTRARDEAAEWQRLAPLVLPPADPASRDVTAFGRLDRRRRRRPSAPQRYMPTRVGNILRAAESRPYDKYGLDAVAVWPHLWLVLPDTIRQELRSARAALDGAVRAGVWGTLFLVFTPWTLWAVPAAALVALAALLFWIPAAAEVFADLVEAAFDLSRTALYEQLRWPLPTDPAHERAEGERLTRYLWRGSGDASPVFTPRGPQ